MHDEWTEYIQSRVKEVRLPFGEGVCREPGPEQANKARAWCPANTHIYEHVVGLALCKELSYSTNIWTLLDRDAVALADYWVA